MRWQLAGWEDDGGRNPKEETVGVCNWAAADFTSQKADSALAAAVCSSSLLTEGSVLLFLLLRTSLTERRAGEVRSFRKLTSSTGVCLCAIGAAKVLRLCVFCET